VRACTFASANTSSGPETSSNWTPGMARIAMVFVVRMVVFRVSFGAAMAAIAASRPLKTL
jgi:hypothetical protein